MRNFILKIVIVLVSGVGGSSAQTAEKPEKMLFSGTINENYFEMTLEKSGGDLRGSYFFLESGKKSALALRGKIDAKGKVILRAFKGANKQTSEFRGELIENTADYDLTFNGVWKSAARRKPQDFYAAGQIIGFTGKRRIETVYIRERNARQRVELDAAYVQIAGGKSYGASGFNLAAKQMIVKPVAKFNRMVARQSVEDRKNMRDDDINLYSAFSYIKFADDRFVSASFFYSENSNGMIHTLDFVKTLNYDLENNRQIKLADLFAPDSKYLETISAYCLKTLQSRAPVNGEKLADGDWANGTAGLAENFECWNLMKKGLLITFNEYSIAPYPAGIQSVLIPYSELKSIAKPGGALAKMTR